MRQIRNHRLARMVWDWDGLQLDGDFGLPRNIRPTDIDSVIDASGHFLWFEGKMVGNGVPTGQRRVFENLFRLNPDRHTLIVLEHECLEEKGIYLPVFDTVALTAWRWIGGRMVRTERKMIDGSDLVAFAIRNWFEAAEGGNAALWRQHFQFATEVDR